MVYDDTLVGGLMVALVMFLLILGVVLLIGYVFDSILKMRIFKLFGTCAPIMAWVPFVSSYYLGRTCNGRDGGQEGIFGIRVPNWLFNFGWLLPTALSGVWIGISAISGGNLGSSGVLGTFSQCMMFIYWSSIYSFLYSRLEGRYEREVRVISIISALFGVVGLIKILTMPTTQVYSLDNDVFPDEPVQTTDEDYGGADW